MNALTLTFVLALVLFVIVDLAVRFAHPDLTETELFLRFWPLHVVVFTLAATAVILANKGSR